MLGRKARPVIGNLITGASGSGYKPGVYDVVTSPKSPLDLIKIQSPRILKNYGAVGVGLGIVAALEKTIESGCIQIQGPQGLYNQNSNRSVPIPVNSVKNRGITEEIDGDSLEDYTYVTSHRPNQKSHTRVYYDGTRKTRGVSDRKSSDSHRMCVFSISPVPVSPAVTSPVTSDFLSSCHMCQKNLQGEDIYMYRGDQAFCSTECRERQILIDEKEEKKCNSQASRSATTSADVSMSPYSSNEHQMFTRGIFAI